MTQQLSRDYRVGMFTFLGIVILCMLILWYGEEPTLIFWRTRYNLAVIVANPTGIAEGTPAFMQGVQVGRVEEITFQDPRQPSKGAAVIVGIEEEFEIPTGSRATIHPQFGFDKGAIHIEPPTQATAALARDNAAIFGEMKGALDSLVPDEFMQEFIPNVAGAVEQIARMAGEIEVVSQDLHQLLQVRTMSMADDITDPTPANFFTAVQRVDQTLKLLNELISDGGDLRSAAADLRRSTLNIGDWSQSLDHRTIALLDQVEQTMQSIRRDVTEVSQRSVDSLGDLSQVLDQLSAALVAVNDGKGVLGKVIHDPKLYEEFIDSIGRLQLLIDELRTTVIWLKTESRLVPGNL